MCVLKKTGLQKHPILINFVCATKAVHTCFSGFCSMAKRPNIGSINVLQKYEYKVARTKKNTPLFVNSICFQLSKLNMLPFNPQTGPVFGRMSRHDEDGGAGMSPTATATAAAMALRFNIRCLKTPKAKSKIRTVA